MYRRNASMISYVTFILSLFVPHLSFLWCLEKGILRDFDISWVSLRILILFNQSDGLLFSIFYFVLFYICFIFLEDFAFRLHYVIIEAVFKCLCGGRKTLPRASI